MDLDGPIPISASSPCPFCCPLVAVMTCWTQPFSWCSFLLLFSASWLSSSPTSWIGKTVWQGLKVEFLAIEFQAIASPTSQSQPSRCPRLGARLCLRAAENLHHWWGSWSWMRNVRRAQLEKHRAIKTHSPPAWILLDDDLDTFYGTFAQEKRKLL